MQIFRRLEQKILQRYRDWLDHRIPPRREITLVQTNIFIYPNVQFIYYFILVLLLWLAATNYENNLAFALSFLLLSLFVICIHHTYNNLSGLTLTLIGADPVFKNEFAEVELLLDSNSPRWRDAIRLGWPDATTITVGLVEKQALRIKVPLHALQRGWYQPGRLTVDTVFPLGIIRAVSYLDLDVRVLVYPQPVRHAHWQAGHGKGSEGDAFVGGRGNEEFSHLDEYQPGLSLKRVAWKQFAKEQGMQVKQYGDYVSQQLWLEWEQFPGLATEERLSTLCYWALQLDKKGEAYGLRLPGCELAPASGAVHRQAVLTALALFGSAP